MLPCDPASIHRAQWSPDCILLFLSLHILESERDRERRVFIGVPRREFRSTRQASVKPSPMTTLDIDTVQVLKANKRYTVRMSREHVSILADLGMSVPCVRPGDRLPATAIRL